MTTLDAAFDALVDELRASADLLREHPFFAESENRPAAYAYLTSMFLARLEGDVVFDPDFPTFRVIDTRVREGGDNPDQRYFMSNIRGGQAYRIWGRLGSARRIELQIYAGDPFRPGSGGRSASFLGAEDIEVAGDGSFEVVAAPERCPGNWIENPADGSEILVRQIYADWSDADAGEIHIDRIGAEGALKPALTEDDMAARLRMAADDLRNHVRAWPAMVEHRYVGRGPANELSPPTDPGALGGVPGRWMSGGVFELDEGEALIVETWPGSGDYQGIQLADLWFSSLEYGNRQTSLTSEQSYRNDGGSYCFVICGTDPGVANWLDTTGRRRGCILLRFDGSTEPFDPAHHPRARKVRLADLPAELPADTPAVSPEQRTADIAHRRRHLQVRFGT